MSKNRSGLNKLARTGNSFPWGGIFAGVRRMIFYTFLLVCLLGVLGAILLAAFSLSDNEPVGDYF